MKRHSIQLTRSSGQQLRAEASFVPTTSRRHVERCLERLIRTYYPAQEGDKLEIV